MITNTDSHRAALYARVSSEQQAQAHTIASQVEAIHQRITQEGLSLEPELCFIDEGYSGATLVRPALERLRDMASAGAIDRLYVHSPDRLARKYAYQVLLVDELQRCGVELVFLNHELGRSPEEDLLLQVQGMIAEYERAKILERSRRGKLHAARRGSVDVLSGAPYGYRYLSAVEPGGSAQYQVVLEEARIVRQVFEWVGQERCSIGEVCRRLKTLGIPTRTGKDYWDRTTVWGMLKNPAYKGLAAFGKTRVGPLRPRLRSQRGRCEQPRHAGSTYDAAPEHWVQIPVPALISPDLFEAVAEQLEDNRKRSRQSARGARYLLQGLLVCARCGYALYGKPVSISAGKGKRRSYAYYRCVGTDAYRFGGQRVCQNHQVRTDMLDEAVWEDVCSLLSNPERIEKEYQRRLTPQRNGVGWEKDQMAALTTKVKRGIARLVDAYEDGLLDRDEFEPRLQRAKQRLASLQGQAQAQSDQESQQKELQLIVGRFEEFAQRVQGKLHAGEWPLRREVIRALVKQVEVDQEEVRVMYRVNPSPFDPAPERGLLQDCWRRDHRPLRRAPIRLGPLPVLRDPGPKPLGNQAKYPAVGDPDLQQLQQPRMIDRVEEAPDVQVQHPVHLPLRDAHPDRIQRFVLVTTRPKAVAEALEVLLVNLVQDPHHRLLDNLVLQAGDAQRPLTAVGFGYPTSLRGLGTIPAALDAIMQVRQPGLQVLSIRGPRHAVQPRHGVTLQRVVRLPQQVDRDVVQQSGEPQVLVPSCGLTYPAQPTRREAPALCPACGRLFRIPLGHQPSLQPVRSPPGHATHSTTGGGFPAPLFRLRGGVTVRP
jgi:site-specific DNA recombinase